MTAGVLCGLAVSYGLIQMTRSGDLLEMVPKADLMPWILVVCLSAFAMLMTAAWVRFGRGICLVLPGGCIIAAGLASQAGHSRLVAPLMVLAGGCVIAASMATFLEDRMRRPT